jgi:hypothetical protein
MDPLTGTSLSWIGEHRSTPVSWALIALVVVALVAFGAWVLRPTSEPAGPEFTCSPGNTYTTEECP